MILTMNNIPKILWFIWLGDNKPNYADYTMKTFKEVNPDFQINFLNCTTEQLNNLSYDTNYTGYDKDIFFCIEEILNYKYSIYYTTINKYLNISDKKRKCVVVLVNILRQHLLNKYGGIYLDCDTFPLRPFDEDLLKLNSFYVDTACGSNHYRFADLYFLGKKNDNVFRDDYLIYEHRINIHHNDYHNSTHWNECRKKYFDLNLKYKEYNNIDNYYIEHFEDNSWFLNSPKSKLCKYDNLFYKGTKYE